MRALWGAALLGVVSSGALAGQTSLFSGVWATNPDLCEQVEKNGTRAVFGNDLAILTLEDGLIAYEFFCDFNEVEIDEAGAFADISAYCLDPGEGFDEQVHLSIYDESRLEFNSTFITGMALPGEGPAESRFLFSRCENVKELKLD